MIIVMIVLITFMFAFTSVAPLILEGKEPGMFIIHPKN